jgi:hypothetical protein
MFWPAERRLGVDDLILSKQRAQERRERFLVRQQRALAMKGQLVATEAAS